MEVAGTLEHVNVCKLKDTVARKYNVRLGVAHVVMKARRTYSDNVATL